MTKGNYYINKEYCLKVLNILKEAGELSSREWAENLSYDGDFTYLRKKTMEFFPHLIGIKGERITTRYFYKDPQRVILDMPIATDIKLTRDKKIEKVKKSIPAKKESSLTASHAELERIFEDICCGFNGECNLRNIKPINCSFCSHQVRIPIPETVQSNRTIATLESKLERLKT